MTTPKLLLLTGTVPGDQSVGAIYLRDLCIRYGRNGIACYAVTPLSTYELAAELSWMPLVLHRMRSYPHLPIPARLSSLSHVGNLFKFLAHQSDKQFRYLPLVHDIASFCNTQGIERIWTLLNTPVMIYLAWRVARKTGIPLYVMVLDPPEHFGVTHQMDPWSVKFMLRDFDSTLKASVQCAVISDEMVERYQTSAGIRSVIMRHGLPSEMIQPPASRLAKEHYLTIGFAGSLYAQQEWEALINALNRVEWLVAGRMVKVRLLGSGISIRTHAPAHVEFLGWHGVEETVALLAETDILYLPYWFDNSFSTTVRLSFPSKLAVYAAAGRPVFYHGPAISTPATYLRRNPIGIACHSLEPDEIIDILSRLVTNDQEYARMARAMNMIGHMEFTSSVFYQRFTQFMQIDDGDPE